MLTATAISASRSELLDPDFTSSGERRMTGGLHHLEKSSTVYKKQADELDGTNVLMFMST
jgi:hypothetical protein